MLRWGKKKKTQTELNDKHDDSVKFYKSVHFLVTFCLSSSLLRILLITPAVFLLIFSLL